MTWQAHPVDCSAPPGVK